MCIFFDPGSYVPSILGLFSETEVTKILALSCHWEKGPWSIGWHGSCSMLQVRNHFVVSKVISLSIPSDLQVSGGERVDGTDFSPG